MHACSGEGSALKCIHIMCVQFLVFDRFVEHELLVEKEPVTIEWKARRSIQQKEAQEQDAAAK